MSEQTGNIRAAELLNSAYQLREGGEYLSSIDLLLEATARFSDVVEVHTNLALCYILNDNLTDAEKSLDRAQELDPDNLEVAWNRCRILLKKNDVQSAFTIAKESLTQSPHNMEGMLVMASCLRLSHQFAAALEYLTIIIQKDSKNAEAFINRGLVYLSTDKEIEALNDFVRAFDLKPFIFQIWDLLLSLKLKYNLFRDVAQLITKMYKIRPHHAKLDTLLLATLEKEKDDKFSIGIYDRILKDHPEHFTSLSNKAILLTTNNDFARAIDYFKRALKIQPDRSDVLHQLGIALQETGDLDGALTHYQKAIMINPEFAECHNNIGNIYQLKSNFQSAISHFQKAVAIDHNDISAKLKILDLLTFVDANLDSSNQIVVVDQKLKKESLLYLPEKHVGSSEILKFLESGDQIFNDAKVDVSTDQCQIYFRQGNYLNCDRYMKLFSSKNIISSFCFSCFKVQISVGSVIDLIKLSLVIRDIKLPNANLRKCTVENRQNVSGHYKAFIYCSSNEEAQTVKGIVSKALEKLVTELAVISIKHGCSEYYEKFPDFESLEKESSVHLRTANWIELEADFDRQNFKKRPIVVGESVKSISLLEFLVIKNWCAYATAIKDPSCKMLKLSQLNLSVIASATDRAQRYPLLP